MSNPFEHGRAVLPSTFIGREHERRRLYDCIIKGESCIIIGEPRVGKTSVLNYLFARFSGPQSSHEYSDSGALFVSYVDAHSLSGQFDEAQFWRYAFRCFDENKRLNSINKGFQQVYRAYKGRLYSRESVENVFRSMSNMGMRLIILVDEMDALVHNVTCNPDFFSWLRSLVQHPTLQKSLSFIVASRLTAIQLEILLRGRVFGSPPFNHMTPIYLGVFEDGEIGQLLDRAPQVFEKPYRKHLTRLTGGYPHILQVAAAEFYRNRHLGEKIARKHMNEVVLSEARRLLSDVWHHWPDSRRIAFISVALANLWYIKDTRSQSTSPASGGFKFIDQNELQLLVKTGFAVPDKNIVGGYRVSAQAFLNWLLTEYTSTSLYNWSKESTLARGLFYRLHAIKSAMIAEENNELLSRRSFRAATISSKTQIVRVFISFVHEDKHHFQSLCQVLAPLKQRGVIELWSSDEIMPGENVEKTIALNLATAHIVLPLISADYLASESHVNGELRGTRSNNLRGETRIAPILVRPVAQAILRDLPVWHELIAPKKFRAVSEYEQPDEAWGEIGDILCMMVEDIAQSLG